MLRPHRSPGLLHLGAWGSLLLLAFCLLGIFAYIFYQAWPHLSWEFLTQAPQGAILGLEGGIAPAIWGSLAFTATALFLAFPPALALAIYLCFEIKNLRWLAFWRGLIQCLAGLPSIVLGLFSYSFLVRGLGLGRSIFSAAVGLAIMILPFIEQRAEKCFQELDAELLRAAAALGCSQRYSLWHLVLPLCRGELLSAALLGAAYAMGAAAPLMFSGAVAYASMPHSLWEPAMALPLHLYLLLAQGPPSFPVAYATAAVMLTLTLLLSLCANLYAFWRKHRG